MYDNEKIYKLALIIYVICWIGLVICVGTAIHDYINSKASNPIEIIITTTMTIVASGGLKEVFSYFISQEANKYDRDNN